MNKDQTESLKLWADLQGGDLEALGVLYDLYVGDLFSYGMQVYRDKSVVMDCIHDLFLNLYKYRKNLASIDRIDFYLMRALKNIILRHNKTSRRESEFKNQDNINSFQISVEDGMIANERELERSRKLTKALKLLSNKQRKGLLLRFTKNYSYEEISERMNISVPSSRTMIYRAIRALREQMQ